MQSPVVHSKYLLHELNLPYGITQCYLPLPNISERAPLLPQIGRYSIYLTQRDDDDDDEQSAFNVA